MNRRAFLGQMIGGIAAAAAVRTWPFRVYSFPSEIRTAVYGISPMEFAFGRVRALHRMLAIQEAFIHGGIGIQSGSALRAYLKAAAAGSIPVSIIGA